MDKKTKILLVDDEALARTELGGLLEDEGYEVLTAADGEAGLVRFRDELPDIIITDVRMPKCDGLQLTSIIHAESPKTPIAVITGHGNEAMAIAALRAGATDFIKKPIKIEDVIAALSRLELARTLAKRETPLALPKSATLAQQSWTYVLNNSFTDIPNIVDAMLENCCAGLHERASVELNLAVRELILNAIEHGNLEFSFEHKKQALEQGNWDDILASRIKTAPYAERCATILITRTSREVIVEVTDDGSGFDWRNLPDPTDPARLLELNGRGILLATTAVDYIAFNETGNTVTIRKQIAD